MTLGSPIVVFSFSLIIIIIIFFVKELVGHSEKGIRSAAPQKDRRSASLHKADRAVIRFPSDFKSHVDNQGEGYVRYFF